MPFLQLDRISMFYSEFDAAGDEVAPGSEPTFLLVHGWGGDGGQWATLLPYLAAGWPAGSEGRRMIIPDLRGHGASRSQWTDAHWAGRVVREDDFGPRAFAADLARLLRELGERPVVAVGHSMGGQVVTALAVDYPELVEALVVLDPAYGASDEEMARIPAEQEDLRREGSAWAARFVAGAFSSSATPGIREREVRLMASTDARVLAAARDGMYLADDAFGPSRAAAAYLKRCQTPTLAIYSNDTAAQWYRDNGMQNPNSVVEVISDVGHYLQLEQPEKVATLLKRLADMR